MSAEPWSPPRAAEVAAVLCLPPTAGDLLDALARLDVDRDAFTTARQEDEQGRSGALSWAGLLRRAGAEVADAEALGAALLGLADWGLVQIVGQEAGDPILTGSSAIRLLHAGRALLGLAPTRRATAPDFARAAEPRSWEVWHGASREGLLLDALTTHPEAAGRPIVLRPDDLRGAALAGRVAERLWADGAAVVDGELLEHPKHAWLVEELLVRTARAAAPRILLLASPAVARYAAVASGARLCWREQPTAGRRESAALDERVTARLMSPPDGPAATLADVCGVPDTELATPRRVDTRWEDLLLPDPVQQQMQHALMHARYRLETLPALSGAGRATGYRLLLSGLPGTGKSMAAEAVATTLGRPLVRLDLAGVLSKWLGETERFLAQIFEVAEVSGSVLVLDEAEALFRQRESGGSGRDGLVTVVSYLLARLDRFTGVLIATTNRTRDLDEAFFRRFDDFVVLPVPDPSTRARLWARHLGVTHSVDLELVSGRFAISGGLIRCAAVRAAAWAEGLRLPLDTPVVLASLARELEKCDRDPKEVLIEPHRAAVQALLRGVTFRSEEPK